MYIPNLRQLHKIDQLHSYALDFFLSCGVFFIDILYIEKASFMVLITYGAAVKLLSERRVNRRDLLI